MRAEDTRGTARGEWRSAILPIHADTILLVTLIRVTTIRDMWDFMAATTGATTGGMGIAGGKSCVAGLEVQARAIGV